MSTNIHTPFYSDSDCISEQDMFDYLDNNLSPIQMHSAEKHMLECEMCSDVMEGLSLVNNRNKIDETKKLVDLKTQIIESKNGKVLSLWNAHKAKFAIAASILLIIGLTGIINLITKEQDKTVLVENKEIKKEPQSKPENSSHSNTDKEIIKEEEEKVEVKESKQAEIAQEVKKELYPNKKISEINNEQTELSSVIPEEKSDKNSFKEFEDVTIEQNSKAEEISLATLNEPSSSAQYKDEIAFTNKQTESDSKPKAVQESKAMERENVKSRSAKSYPPSPSPSLNQDISDDILSDKENNNDLDLLNGKRFYKKEDYSAAIISFEEYFKRNNNNPEAIIYCAISYVKTGKPNNALALIDIIFKGGHTSYFEQADYYKALAFIQQKSNQKAMTLLEEIVKQNGEYKKKAQDKLKELE
ncbi:MAG: hypothetical protein M3Q58_05935 [Bacteroidota bacterium]|nr:hypothetical protein [Bacteroidota bacterium]